MQARLWWDHHNLCWESNLERHHSLLFQPARGKHIDLMLRVRIRHLPDSAGHTELCWQAHYMALPWAKLLLFPLGHFLYSLVNSKRRQNSSSSLERGLWCESWRSRTHASAMSQCPQIYFYVCAHANLCDLLMSSRAVFNLPLQWLKTKQRKFATISFSFFLFLWLTQSKLIFFIDKAIETTEHKLRSDKNPQFIGKHDPLHINQSSD